MPSNSFISRRSLLNGVAATAAATPLIQVSAINAAETNNAEFRAIHRFHIGNMCATIIDDARFTLPSPMFAINQPKGTIEPFMKKFGLSTDFVSLHMQITLIENGVHKILLDTGMGEVTLPGNKPDNGRLIAGLAAIGISPDEITSVIISHGHPDHIGACSHNGVPTFKNAIYHMPSNELEFWSQKPDSEESFPNFMLAVANAQLEPVREMIRPYKDGDEIVDGITAVAAFGHTLGHHAFLIHNGTSKLLHLMDAAVHYLVGPEEPDWAMAVEMNQTAAADTRRKLFKQAEEQNLLVAGYHFPFPGIGRIAKLGLAWRYIPVQTTC